MGGRTPLVLVPVYVEGKGPYEFILDTGAYSCLLSSKLSASIGVLPEDQEQAMEARGSLSVTSAHLRYLAVGSNGQRDVEAAILGETSPDGGDLIPGDIDGVLGSNFLREFQLAIDCQQKVLHLRRSLPTLPNERPSRSTLMFKLAGRSGSLIVIPTLINQKGPFRFVLDTGASRTTMSSKIASKLGMVTTGDQTRGEGTPYVRLGTANAFSVGTASVSDLNVGVGTFLDVLSTSAGTPLDGIIGEDFLSQFEVTIDYPRRMIDLKRVVR